MPTEINAQKSTRKFFHKTDFVKMGGTVLVTLLAVFLFNIFSNESSTYSLVSKSVDIPADTLLQLFKNSQDSKHGNIMLRYKENETDAVYKYDKLWGFRFNADDLYAIIRENKIKDDNGVSIMPKEVMFFLGQDIALWKKNPFSSAHPNIRIIAIGVTTDSMGKLQLMLPEKKDYNDAKKSSIYDKADPCPGPGCPTKPPPPIP